MKFRLLVIWVLVTSGCTAAFRASSGGATSRPGVEGSGTHSIVIGDRGGVITRASLLALGIFGAAGAVEQTSSKTERTNFGDKTVIRTETTYNVDTKALQASADLMNAAVDPNVNVSGIAAYLEIASTKLGGDTGGWIYKFGYASRWGRGSGFGARLFAGIGFGELTHYQRVIRRYDTSTAFGTVGTITTATEDSDYIYAGTPVRFALTYGGLLEAYFEGEFNWITPFADVEVVGTKASEAPVPSPWTLGIRGTYAIGFVGAFVMLSSMRPEERSYGFETGIDF